MSRKRDYDNKFGWQWETKWNGEREKNGAKHVNAVLDDLN